MGITVQMLYRKYAIRRRCKHRKKIGIECRDEKKNYVWGMKSGRGTGKRHLVVVNRLRLTENGIV
jgi:hypothetical protein